MHDRSLVRGPYTKTGVFGHRPKTGEPDRSKRPDGLKRPSAPFVSVIVPLYNEQKILVDLVKTLREQSAALPFETELLLCENGSLDHTRDVANHLVAETPNVRLVTINKPSYGAAIKMGILEAHADLVVIFNADLWCPRFFRDAVSLLQNGFDLVISSKRHPASVDRRPPLRRFIKWSFNTFLRAAFAFEGTDTHGMKAFRRSRVVDIVSQCRTEREVFDTELVLRCQRAGLKMRELPVEVRENRAPRLGLLKRIPSTARDMFVIWSTLDRA